MKKYINGQYIELTADEIAAMQADKERLDAEYWASVDYGDAVNAKIRERYSESQEFAVLRQKEEKPEEYQEYFTYCEACKDFVKTKKAGAV